MRSLHAVVLSLLAVSWLGCSTVARAPLQQAWEGAEVECIHRFQLSGGLIQPYYSRPGA